MSFSDKTGLLDNEKAILYFIGFDFTAVPLGPGFDRSCRMPENAPSRATPYGPVRLFQRTPDPNRAMPASHPPHPKPERSRTSRSSTP